MLGNNATVHFVARHAIPCDAGAYWRHFADEGAFRQLCARLGVTAVEAFEVHGTVEEGFARRTVTVAPIEAPWLLRRALGLEGGVRNVEEGRFDPATGVWTFRLTPTTHADRLDVVGTVRLEPVPDGTSRRVFAADIVVDAGPLGPLAERVVEAKLRQTQEQIVGLLRETFAARREP